MTILRHELKQNRTSFWVWTAVISFMIGVCVFIYPEMKGEMESISDVFADMGSFSAAFAAICGAGICFGISAFLRRGSEASCNMCNIEKMGLCYK